MAGRAPHLALSPWLRRLSRLLAMVAGALLIVGPLRPWVFLPFGGLRLPIYGLFSLGGLSLATGFFLLLHPRPGPVPLLIIAAGAWYLGAVVPPQMLVSARATTGIIESWLDPINQLLGRFHIEEIHLIDWTLPAARAVGPGVSLTLWGSGLALAAAVADAIAAQPISSTPRACPSCAARLPRHRALRFCPACGGALSPEPVCGRCGVAGEVGDRFCGRCGERLPALPSPE